MTRFTYKKAERLTGKTTIDRLFNQGESFFSYPFRVIYLPHSILEESQCRVLINVPKRLHKHASTRNRLKRCIKEAYRLHKPDFYAALGEHKLHLAFLYSAKEELDYGTIDSQMIKAQAKLLKRLR